MTVYKNIDYIKTMRPLPKGWPQDIEGIPFVKKSKIDIKKMNNGLSLINVLNTTKKDKNSNKKIVHFFKENDVLYRLYNNPYKVIDKVCAYYAVSTMDFAMHEGMQRAQIIYATFQNRWFGAFLQANGYKNVVVTVGWVNEDTYDVCFAGIEDGTLLLISTMGVSNIKNKNDFIKGYKEMRNRFPNSQVICLGNRLDGMDNDVCFVEYKNSFGNDDKYNTYWQPSLFNWDGSEV